MSRLRVDPVEKTKEFVGDLWREILCVMQCKLLPVCVF